MNKVTIKDIVLRCKKHITPYINFYYVSDNFRIREAEVVMTPSELYEEIMDCSADGFAIDNDKCLYIDTDIIIYINKVLKNPAYPKVIKDMLSVYKQKVLNGEIF